MQLINQLRSQYEKHHIFFDLFFIFMLTVIAYGLLIPFLGFYWDDLPYLYQLNAFGPTGFQEYVASDRPFSTWIFMLTTWLFRFEPLGYHLLALFLRFLASALFYGVLRELWPKKNNLWLFSAIIFAIYPGFLQQPIALIYNHHLSVLCLFLGSVFLMIKAVSTKKIRPLTYILSVLMTFHMFSIENFALLELIKPVVLWIVLSRIITDAKTRLKRTLIIWLPYLLVFMLFFIWRVFIFQFPTYDPGLLQSMALDPITAISSFLQRIPRDFFTATIGAWLFSFDVPKISQFGTAATYLLWVIVGGNLILSFTFLGLFVWRKEKKEDSVLSVLIVGLLLFILGASVIWVLELPLKIEFAWDRMTIGLIPGVALLIGLIADSIHKKSKTAGILLLGLLIAFAEGSHFENGMRYKRDWENLQSLLQQLTWRIPNLEEQTVLLTSDPGLTYYSDNSLTSPINLTYSDFNNNLNLEYFLFFTDVRLGLGLPELRKDIPINQGYRSFMFEGNTSRIVAFQNNPPACLKVMDRVYSNSITNLNLTDLQTQELRLTDLDLIQSAPLHTPPSFLVENPDETNWCYYFQKADLARQFGDHQTIGALGDQALSSNLRPREASEWLPFLEGYGWLGQWDKVNQVLDEVFIQNPDYQNGICYTLRRMKNTTNFPFPEKITEIFNAYNCQ